MIYVRSDTRLFVMRTMAMGRRWRRRLSADGPYRDDFHVVDQCQFQVDPEQQLHNEARMTILPL